jgi:hypothetical protein
MKNDGKDNSKQIPRFTRDDGRLREGRDKKAAASPLLFSLLFSKKTLSFRAKHAVRSEKPACYFISVDTSTGISTGSMTEN